VAELRLKYSTALEKCQKAAQDAGKLEAALAYQNEIKLMADGMEVPAEAEKVPPDLQKLRGIYHQSLLRLETDKNKATNPIIAALIVSMDRLVATLTKAGRLDEALFVQQKKEKLGEETAKAVAKPASAAANKTPPVKGVVTNSLGMKFVPVPGTTVLVCIHETRRQDYAAYAAAAPGVKDSWKKQQFNGISVSPKDDHPVAGASLEDAKAFCAWLSKKEGKNYRVPTDREWSCAVGIGEQEKDRKDLLPKYLTGNVPNVFPWDGAYPPKTTDHAGNYADTTLHEALPPAHKQPWIDGYTDGFATTAPVMSFKPNEFGIYDLGGNLYEWCSDRYGEGEIDWRVLRGAAWNEKDAGMMLSSKRAYNTSTAHQTFYGFRVVLEQP
jgi:sulfatase-modifying factor enzyme 1